MVSKRKSCVLNVNRKPQKVSSRGSVRLVLGLRQGMKRLYSLPSITVSELFIDCVRSVSIASCQFWLMVIACP